MFNNYAPWDFHQSAGQPNAFSLTNLECVGNDIASSEVQYTGSYTKSAGNVQFNGNNLPHRYDRTFDYTISSKGTSGNLNTHKNYEYAVQSNGININQNIYNNSNDSQTLHHLYNNNHLYRKDIPNCHPSSKLAQLLNNNGNTNSFQNMNSHYLNQNASDQQIKYNSQSNIPLNKTQFQSSVTHNQLPCKNSSDQINKTNNSGELNAVQYNFQLGSTQCHNKLNRHENGLFNNNKPNIYKENNFANCSSALQKKTEETFRQQIWVKDIESLNASTINEISHSSVTEMRNQTDHLNKISGTGVSQHNVRGKSVIERNCIQTATSNMLPVNLKDNPLQNTSFTNTFSSNTVSNNAKIMNCIADVKTENFVNIDSNTFIQKNENQNEPNLDNVPSKSDKNSSFNNDKNSILNNETAEKLNVSSSISENKSLSNLYSTALDKEENSDILQNTNETNLTASSQSVSYKELENTTNNIIKKKLNNHSNCSSNKPQKRREQRNCLMSNKNNNNMESYEKYDSLSSSVLVNSSEIQDKNSFNIKCMVASNKETEIKQALQNENSSAISNSNSNIQLKESKNSEAVTDKEVNKAKKRKLSKVTVQKNNVRSSKKRMSNVEAKPKNSRKTGNSNINKKDQNLIKDSVNVNSFSRKRSSNSFSKKNNKNLPKNSKTQQKSHKENKNSTVSPNESKTCNRSNRHKKVKTKTSEKNAYKNRICANQNKSDCIQKSTTEFETVDKRKGRKKVRKSMYFRNSLIDRKKLDLLIKYVEGNTNLKSSVDCDIKNSEICNDEDSIIDNTNDGSSESENFYSGASLNSENISARPEDIKQENVFEILHEKDSLVQTKKNQRCQLKSATPVSQGGLAAKGMVQVFKKFISDKNDSGTNSEAEELHDICMLANFEDKTMLSGNLDDTDNEGSYTKDLDEKLRELKHLGSNKCIGCESMIPMDKFWLKVTTGELKCAECLISSDKRAKEKKMQWKLLRENEELKLENLTLKHKIRKWIENNTIKNQKISDCPDIGINNIPSESLEKENKNYKTKGRRGRRKFKEIGGELENEISTKDSKTWRKAKTCIKPKKKKR